MRFLVDAQLPRRLARWLAEQGHDAAHTLDLPLGNRTPDADIVSCAVRESRIVVTKDSDFVNTFLLTGQPLLLFVSTGNVSNDALERLLHLNMPAIEQAFLTCRRLEVTRTSMIVYE